MPFFDPDTSANVNFGETEVTGSDKHTAVLIAGVTPSNTSSFVTVFEDGSMKVESELARGTTVNVYGIGTTDASFIEREKFHNTGSTNLNVDGSVTANEFVFRPESSQNVKVNSVKFCLVCDRIINDGNTFGSMSSLTNGIELSIVQSGVKTIIANIQKIEDFYLLPGPNPEIDRTGTNDVLISTYFIGGSIVLTDAEQDFISIVIRDDLTNSTIRLFEAVFYGIVE